jgi:hypothetical protein
VTWAAKYQPNRDQYWPEVEHFFANLPPHLFRQGVLLKNNLATFYSDTGQFKDILSREHDLPLLYLHFWLLDNLDYPHIPVKDELEKHLFLALAFTFAAVYTQESILDEGANFDNRYLFLERALTQQADFHLDHLFPGPSPFWNYHQTFWQEYAEAVLITANPRPPTPDPQPLSSKLAFTKIPAAAVAIGIDRIELLPQLCAMLDQLNLVLQTLRDISTIRRDLGRRNLTYPILRTMQVAGLDPHQPTAPEQILGAMVLTGTIEKISQECLAWLLECRAISTSLNLPTFSAYFGVVENLVGEIRELFSLKKEKSATPPSAEKQRRPIFAPYVDTLSKVIEMAEGYLLSDPTFRESWEIQRRGVFGVAEMTGQAFPTGLIVEILCRHGHDMAVPLDIIFKTLQATGFRYYNHPHLPPDADDLGLLLRLYSYSTQRESHRDILQTPLRWLKANVLETGEIPVWLRPNDLDDGNGSQLNLALWGNSCATVEANVLLGLIDYDWARYYDLIEKSARNWCERLIANGLGATLHYVPLYSLWTAFELITKLSSRSIPLALRDKLGQTASTLAEILTNEAKRPGLTPQDAAFLILTCLPLEQWSPKLALVSSLESDWITLLCKSQRYDGSWAGEPFYGTPTRGELATWYSSRPVTTAFCYAALKTYRSKSS